LCAEHVTAFAKRVGEMREPPLGLDVVPDKNLEIFFDEILASPTTEELVLGIYDKAMPALKIVLERHRQETNPLADAPSVRLCRFALLDVDDMIAFGKNAERGMRNAENSEFRVSRSELKSWLALLDDCLAAAGAVDGSEKNAEHGTRGGENSGFSVPGSAFRKYSTMPFQYDKVPKRDARFSDPYNMGVNAEVFLYDEKFPAQAKTLMMFYKRLREIDVPEMMASIIVETPGKPWDYYRDMTRQLWDEARHAMMGEVGFTNLEVDWRKVMVNFTWSLALNTQLTPMERHGVLYFIEQGLMPKNGKRYEWEVALASHNPLSGLFQDYDWADEVLHARIGRDWYLKEFKDAKSGVKYGDQCWSKVLLNWKNWRDAGLTQHRNWWPEIYRDACKSWGIAPNPEVLAFNTSYEKIRADLKDLSASA
ncbi:MAG: hypothetical protein M3Y82_02635, partial [Verrucomicrobiota bacterium]|nr:hypothetical protein [Verrucomicrobiota bacterium]